MRVLLVCRGASGSGKTTWIKNNKLIPYSLSLDNMKMLFTSPIQTIYGLESIKNKENDKLNDLFFTILNERLKNGEFTVIDGIHQNVSDINRYKEYCLRYKYQMYIIDFTNIPIKQVKEQNLKRLTRKRVPEFIIDDFYNNLELLNPNKFNIIKPDETDKLKDINLKQIDFNKYKKINVIGDIHGCFKALTKGINDNGGIKNDECYVFLGDYTDKGDNNYGVIKFLLSLKDKENVFICEGNHERHIWNYCCNDIDVFLPDSSVETIRQMQYFSKKDLKKLQRKMYECVYASFNEYNLFFCHGGIAYFDNEIEKISTKQLIYGVGNYSDVNQVADTFNKKHKDKFLQFFGHRGTNKRDCKINDTVFCLEDGVEKNGFLVWAVLTKNKKQVNVEIKKYKEN